MTSRGDKRHHSPPPALQPTKRPCRYGSTCYRQNPQHFAEFDHPPPTRASNNTPACSSSSSVSSTGVETSSAASSSKTSHPSSIDPTKQTVSELSSFGFHLFRVSGLNYGRMPTMTLRDLLSIKHGTLVESAQFNYMFDLPWLVSQYPEPARSAPLLIVHGLQGPSREPLAQSASNFSNIRLCQAHIRLPFGTHHSKMMLLLYKDGLRIVIHTANMIHDDWSLRTQGIWSSPKLAPLYPNVSARNSDSPTKFRRDLITYLRAYGSSVAGTPSSPLGRWIALIENHDFSPIRVHLVSSVSGQHSGPTLDFFGHTRLKKLLASSNQTTPSNWPIIAQFSSIGSLGAQPTSWLTTEWSSSLAGRGARGIRLIYPSVDNVRNSLEGYASGGCLPYQQATASKQPWLKQFLHKWTSSSGGFSRAIPHIKSYSRVSPDGNRLAWFLLTSSNLSKAAWGNLVKSGSQLMVRSYELGVLFLPDQYQSNAKFFANAMQEPGIDQDLSSSPSFPVPFKLPPELYDSDDEPWIFDKSYKQTDVFGNSWSF